MTVGLSQNGDELVEKVFLAARPLLADVSAKLQRGLGTNQKSSEQHILNGNDLEGRMPASVVKDAADCQTSRSWFESHGVWDDDEPAVRNISDGNLGAAGVNCHEAETVGNLLIQGMLGKKECERSHTKLKQCVNFAHACKLVIYDGGKVVGKCEPGFVFQRFFLFFNSGDGERRSEEVTKHELSPCPLAMGKIGDMLLSPTKLHLAHAIKKSVPAAEQHQVPAVADNTSCVWDMGSLLHRHVNWATTHGGEEMSTYADVVKPCVNHVTKPAFRRAKHVAVFDCYDGGPQTKDNTRLKRSAGGMGKTVSFPKTTRRDPGLPQRRLHVQRNHPGPVSEQSHLQAAAAACHRGRAGQGSQRYDRRVCQK